MIIGTCRAKAEHHRARPPFHSPADLVPSLDIRRGARPRAKHDGYSIKLTLANFATAKLMPYCRAANTPGYYVANFVQVRVARGADGYSLRATGARYST